MASDDGLMWIIAIGLVAVGIIAFLKFKKPSTPDGVATDPHPSNEAVNRLEQDVKEKVGGGGSIYEILPIRKGNLFELM